MKKILFGFLPLLVLGLATAWPQEEEEEKKTSSAPAPVVTNAPAVDPAKPKKAKTPKPQIGRAHV